MNPETCEFRIESNVPMPVRNNMRDKYPWDLLNVGESFLVPLELGKTHQRISNSITSCRRVAERRSGKKFATRWNQHGIRVWRVS